MPNQIAGFQREIAEAKDSSPEKFFTWFDAAPSADEAFQNGFWDFAFHILRPVRFKFSQNRAAKVLEIGHGGGRILSAAAHYFDQAYGVDIHHENATVQAELAKRNITNVTLLQGQGTNIPLPDASIDFVYSYVVLQHVEKKSIFLDYMRETYRVLRPGGSAILYYGRYSRFSNARAARWRYALDCLTEWLVLRSYAELEAPVNHTNLIFSRRHVRQLARAIGFQVVRQEVAWKDSRAGFHAYGGQFGIVLRKP